MRDRNRGINMLPQTAVIRERSKRLLLKRCREKEKLGYVPIKPYQTQVTHSKHFNNRGEFRNNDTEIYYVIALKLEGSHENARV